MVPDTTTRIDEIRQALRDTWQKPMTPTHWRAYSRHSVLNLGEAEKALVRRKDPLDAGKALVFSVLPPSHHSQEQMQSMLPHSHLQWYRRGAGRGPDPRQAEKAAWAALAGSLMAPGR